MNSILEDAYALQIDYDPECPDFDMIKMALQKLAVQASTEERAQWEQKIREHRKTHRSVKCHVSVTLIDRKDIDLMSEAQLVYFPIQNKEVTLYFPLDAVSDIEALLSLRKNPFTNEILTEEQIAFLHRAKLNHKFPKIKVGEFFEEIDHRLKGASPTYIEKEYQHKMRELVSLIESTEIVVYEIAQIYNFACDYNLAQYNLFLRHKPIKQTISDCSRDDASAKTLNHILNYLNIQKQLGPDHGKIAIVNIAYAIDEFIYMMRNLLTYEELLQQRGIAYELYWKPNFVEEGHYKNGNLKLQYYVDEDNNKHGSYTEWYQNGNLAYQSTFDHGTEHHIVRYYGTGEKAFQNDQYFYINGSMIASPKDEGYELFDEAGKFLSLGTLCKDARAIKFTDNDKDVGCKFMLSGNIITSVSFNQNGPSLSWTDSGNLECRKYYHHGQLQGIAETFYDNTKLKSRTIYNLGKKVDILLEYHSNGTLKRRGCYDEDAKECGLWYVWNNRGILIICSFYDNGKSEGLQTKWHDNGQLESEGLFLNSKQIGLWYYWHSNGVLSRSESYINGKLNGSYHEWDDEGRLIKQGSYDEGEKIGSWTSYYTNGNPRLEEYYDHGKKDGIYKSYHQDGILQSEERYDQGHKSGTHTYYYSTGKLKKSTSYANNKIISEKQYNPNQQLVSDIDFAPDSDSLNFGELFSNIFNMVNSLMR